MASAKDIIVKPITRAAADDVIKRFHYSGKVVNNSQLHLGVYLNEVLLGAMQFGPSLDKRKIQALVRDTGWNEFLELNRMAFADALPHEFLELNRMAFADALPRNSESRAIAVAMRMLRKHAPHVKWVISFADGAQCGDGTIYRASGFVLTGIKRNTQIWAAPSGEQFSRTSLTDGRSKQQQQQQARQVISRTSHTKGTHVLGTGAASMRQYAEAGWRPLDGFQLRYIYFIDAGARDRLTVPVLPFEMIDKVGARMYRGKQPSRAGSIVADAPAVHAGEGGSIPTPALHLVRSTR